MLAAGKVDRTSIDNAFMFLNTLRTNRKLEESRRASVAAAGEFKKSTMPYTQLTAPVNTNKMLVEKQAANLRSTLDRVGRTTDVDRSIGMRLAGERQINEGLLQNNSEFAQRTAMHSAQQSALNVDTMKYNLGVQDMNSEYMAKVRSELLKNPLPLMNDAALKNFIIGQNQNRQVREKKAIVNKYFDTVKDPKIRLDLENLSKEYTDHRTAGYTDAQAKFDARIHTSPTVSTEPETFLKSPEYKKWKMADETIEKRIREVRRPIDDAHMAVQAISYKEGGELKARKFQHSVNKDNNAARMKENALSVKEKEILYKAIFHNNEMLLKSLAVIFG
jgi:hypothetical protein